MATSFAMEKLNDDKKKIVLMAPAVETATQTKNFYKLLNLPDTYCKLVDDEILRTRGLPAEWYSTSRAVKTFKAPVLWIHDTDDIICPYKDTAFLQTEKLPHVEFVTTKGLGHNQIYRDADVQKMIIDFLEQ